MRSENNKMLPSFFILPHALALAQIVTRSANHSIEMRINNPGVHSIEYVLIFRMVLILRIPRLHSAFYKCVNLQIAWNIRCAMKSTFLYV